MRRAVAATLAEGLMTPDLDGTATTAQVVDAVLSHLAAPWQAGRGTPGMPSDPSWFEDGVASVT